MDHLPPGIDLSKVPLAVNPSGALPNFINPPDLEIATLVVGVVFIVISSITVGLRLIANLKHTGKLGFDDVFCITGLVSGIAYWAIMYSFGTDGTARHGWDIPLSVVTKSWMKRQFADILIASLMFWASKAAILALYIRVFDSVRWMRITCYILIILTGLFYLSYSIVALVLCLPRKSQHESWDAKLFARCSNLVSPAVASGVFSLVADIVIFILPFPVILKLQLNSRKRMGLVIVFATGFMTIVTSIIGLVYRVFVFLGKDATWNGTNAALVCMAEVFSTVIVSCAPALASFWHNIVTQTRFYSSIRSGLLSRQSRSTSQKDSVFQAHQYDVEKSSRNANHYKTLDDGQSSRKTSSSAEMKNVAIQPEFITNAIPKSTKRDQIDV